MYCSVTLSPVTRVKLDSKNRKINNSSVEKNEKASLKITKTEQISGFGHSKLYLLKLNKAWFYNKINISKALLKLLLINITLRKKCTYLELLRSAFSRIRIEYGEISFRIQSGYEKKQIRISPNTDTFTQCQGTTLQC